MLIASFIYLFILELRQSLILTDVAFVYLNFFFFFFFKQRTAPIRNNNKGLAFLFLMNTFHSYNRNKNMSEML